MKPGKLLSGRIKELREAAGLSQQELATRADLSVSQVAKLEQGAKADPRLSTLLALAGALGVKPGQILDDLPWLLPNDRKESKSKKKERKPRKEKGRKGKKDKKDKKEPTATVESPGVLPLSTSDNGITVKPGTSY